MDVFTSFRKLATLHPTETVVIQNNKNIIFTELLDLSEKVAAGLKQDGIKKGDRISIHVGNKIELLATYYACLKIGAIFVPINLKISANEAKKLIQHSSSRLYIGDAIRFHEMDKEIESCPTIEKKWIIDLSHSDENHHTRSWDNVISNVVPDDADDRHTDEIASLFYTSGTTGQPKGIVYSQQTLVDALNLTQATINPTLKKTNNKKNVIVSLVDLASPWSILITLAAIQKGYTVLLLPESNINELVELLKKKNIAWIAGTPSNFQAVINVAEKQNAPLNLSDTVCVVGGDVCGTELSQRFLSCFGSRLQSSYGQTELGGPVMYHHDLCAFNEPSIGWALPSVKFRIESTSSEGKGELFILTPAKAVGIWNGHDIDWFPSERWLATGDIVQQAPDGHLIFIGRRKEQIKIEGYPVYPVEIEQTLIQHQDIFAAVAFSVPDTFSGERIIALVQTASDNTPSAENLSEFLSHHIANYKQPSEYLFVQDIALATMGKISRRKLSNQYEQLKNQAIKYITVSTQA
ncbi:ligase [Lonsdalea britannica]|uniref:Ligase n=1 Tax=Lonsdalea britannica TaxID=1082704 RepID=A0AAD0SH29_9GAMM|nr:class I adenylate-forming enzyme family protein [Lonsdalea britannica]AXW87084.1 ligase [Lonsdalea britannica]OSM99237.1 ligase [Lonsdalea britannica]